VQKLAIAVAIAECSPVGQERMLKQRPLRRAIRM
jgi:hypothetical protein